MADTKSGQSKLQSWFGTTPPVTIDIVGEFAGSELFLIHGESLLRHCLVDSKVDFDDGFQLLHAVYSVENFLSNLYQRGCNFDIVFFRDLRSLAAPPGAKLENAYKYQLARTVIINHLAKLGPPTSQNGNRQQVLQFDSPESPDFESYLEDHPVHFVFCHEGEDAENHDTVHLRHLIYKFISDGAPVASINAVEWRSSKVFTSMRSAASSPLESLDINEEFDLSYTPSPTSKAIHEELQSTDISSSQLYSRETLATLVSKQVLNKGQSIDGIAAQSIQAFLLHIALLQNCSLHERRDWTQDDPKTRTKQDAAFLQLFSEIVLTLLENNSKLATSSGEGESDWDLYDLLDGYAYYSVSERIRSRAAFPEAATKKGQMLWGSIADAASSSLTDELQRLSISSPGKATSGPSDTTTTVLPFSHPVLNDYIRDIEVDYAEERTDPKTDAVFKDLNHWVNNKVVIPVKKGPSTTPVADARAISRAMKRHQRFMAEIAAYSASLTGSHGRMIDPETVVVSTTKPPGPGASKGKQDASSNKGKESKGKAPPKGKKPVTKGGRENALKAVQEVQDRKAQSQRDIVVRFWRDTCVEIQRDPEPVSQYLKAVKFLYGRSKDDMITLGSEIQLYLCHLIGLVWAGVRKNVPASSRDGRYLLAMEFNWIQDIAKIAVTPAVADAVKRMNKYLDMPGPALKIGTQPQPLAFEPNYKPAKEVGKLSINYRTLQLEHAGPYMDRRFDSQPDSRVPFEPDAWQRKVLDSVDADNSILVVAPTSAGKTFISFYAMKKVLEESDDAVLVYVAPTKALVNQVAAEVGARFSKSYHGKSGKSVWGIYTRDYRINSSTGCQILVTVPHILQSMLLAPANATSTKTKSWSQRIKRIIFDEVHSIGQDEDGVIWEQLLISAPCPIVALSATVGNPQEFRDWLALSQAKKGYKMDMIVHEVRYSDLRKFVYEPPKDFSFQGLQKAPRLPVPGLDEGNVVCPNLRFVHPVSVLTDRNRAALKDVTLEARDCLTLWKQMTKLVSPEILKKLGVQEPAAVLPEVIAKSDVLLWEANLKAALAQMMTMGDSIFPKLRESLEGGDMSHGGKASPEGHIETLFSLACDLHTQDALPALVFNHLRGECEQAAQSILNKLKAAEDKWKESSTEWTRKLQAYERWKKAKSAAPKDRAAARSKDADGDGSKSSKLDMAREAGSNDTSPWEDFDPQAPLEEFSFADSTKLQRSELDQVLSNLQYAQIPPWLMEALARGVGVHHAGMNRRYRQAVEILFRKGFLRLAIATGTLAMGINMPCKTVVFSGNTLYLTAQNFRQAAGRAGRRGFDLLGNVVFNGLAEDRVYEITSSRLPDLRGQFPVSTTLILRLFGLLEGTKNSKYAADMAQSFLSHNHLYLGGPESETSIKHHLRFSIEYLRRQQLLSADGTPINFSGLVSELYFTENAVFAFHSLLKGGYFHELCAGVEDNPDKILLEILLVLSHLFNRIPVQLRHAPAEGDHKSPPVISLPRLPATAENLILEHNKETLSIFKSYVKSYISHNLADKPDNTLPFTKLTVGQSETTGQAPTVRSPFVALSGLNDDFDTIHELCSTARGDVFLEESAIPYVPVWPHDTQEETNAYIYDFWRHGNMDQLVKDNMIGSGDVWYLLKDFAMTLAAVVSSLETIVLNKSDADDDDEEDMAEMHDLGEDPSDRFDAPEPVSIQAPPPPPKKTKKKAVVDSWDDEDDEDEDSEEEATSTGGNNGGDVPSWKQKGGSLKDVLKAFTMLRDEFDAKFKKVWA